jgi:DNA-nicking Smr family endonuclease
MLISKCPPDFGIQVCPSGTWCFEGKTEGVILYGLDGTTEMNSKKNKGEDLAAFETAMADVRPLTTQNRIGPHMPRPPAIARQLELDEKSVLEELMHPLTDPTDLETGEELLYLRQGHQPKLLRRLRRGQFSVSDIVDLHHMDKATATEVLLDFLAHAIKSGNGCVRIIHGKGLRSKTEPILKNLTRRLLSRHSNVIAFVSCRPVDGGTGAVNVLLRLKKRSRV